MAAALGAALGAGLGAALGAALGTGAALSVAGAALAAGAALGRLGLCGKSHPLGTERGVRLIRRLRGQVVDHFFSPRQVVDHFFALRQGQLGRLGPGGLPLGLGAGCACFIGFV